MAWIPASRGWAARCCACGTCCSGTRRSGSRRNIAAHYDLGNEFFRLFLSADLMYSAGMWTQASDTLESASARKLDVICRKLDLKPGQRVMEIGTGWGGFALYAGTAITAAMSPPPRSRANSMRWLPRASPLPDCRTALNSCSATYRDLTGHYDRVVSIEMIEAVGASYLPAYFGKIGNLLKADGLALIQAITHPRIIATSARCAAWISSSGTSSRAASFPALRRCWKPRAAPATWRWCTRRIFGTSYAWTLRVWRERFMARLGEARQQGFR